jgi:L-idonate 5-dehydrogenase
MILIIARAYGASGITVSDPRPSARAFAEKNGGAETLDPTETKAWDGASDLAPNGFEVVFEASGAAAALDQAIRLAARGATVVQVGTLEDGVSIPANALLTKELSYVGSWRFANVFDRVISLVSSGKIDPRPLITHTFRFEQLKQAFTEARHGESSVKVQIQFA